MDINLTIYDVDLFIKKYTRFMTKDIYISYKLYNNFLKQYDYLFKKLKKEKFLYSNNNGYKRVMEIIENKYSLLKLHNKKYLNGALKRLEDESFLSNLKLNEKMLVLTEEENTYVVSNNYIDLIVGKLNYLINYKKYKEESILLLTKDDNKYNSLREIFKTGNINVSILNINNYIESINKDNILTDSLMYNILSDYIINILYKDKIKFNKLYKAFSHHIYLNKDYIEYDSFKDYHSYMYKRKYLKSGLTLERFIDKEIESRKRYLRTILNESVMTRDEVDISNFLYLNSIDYVYKNGIFILDNGTKIKFTRYDENTYLDDTIYLSAKNDVDNSYLRRLSLALLRKSYSLVKRNDEEVYNTLKTTSIDNYFSEFINKYLMPLIKCYEEYNNLDNVNLDKDAKEEFLNIYRVFNEYINTNNLIKEKDIIKSLENKISKDKYKYLFILDDIDISFNIPILKIVEDYNSNELIKDNIKLSYEYKKYLYDNQIIPIKDVYINKEEISTLTKNFLKDNLKSIDESLKNTSKDITVYTYNDINRLLVYNNIADVCISILNKYKDNTLMVFNTLKDTKILINNNNFIKIDNNTLSLDNRKVKVEEVYNIDKLYDTIILPYIVKDRYHEDLFIDNYIYNLKAIIYDSLSKCKNNIVILCPESKINKLDNILGNFHKNIEFV